jgi:uncharacterized protein (DUF1499 family)
MWMTVWVLLAVAGIGMAYVRLAPSDPARWHVMPVISADKNFRAGVIRVLKVGPEGLARLDAVARATPRTRVLAGSVAEAMVTYVTRSAVFGFPDYTTVMQDGEVLKIHARQRFGRSDFGVNRGRVEAWIRDLQL